MPRVVGEDDGVLFVEIHRQHLLTRLLERGVIDLLAAVIQLLELASDHVRFVLVLREYQLDSANGVAESPSRVQSRGKNETDSSRGQLASTQSRRAQQRSH